MENDYNYKSCDRCSVRAHDGTYKIISRTHPLSHPTIKTIKGTQRYECTYGNNCELLKKVKEDGK